MQAVRLIFLLLKLFALIGALFGNRRAGATGTVPEKDVPALPDHDVGKRPLRAPLPPLGQDKQG